ncbi:MAG: hypothetical protein K2O00_09055 [Muribaculaceae bacterium]|nr:hypothetical protein [Muribaculaceae bacterium]
MNGRKDRIELITGLIRDGKVTSQEQLRDLLESEGVSVTQATLSRDLRMLGATRRFDQDGKPGYVLPEGLQSESRMADEPQLELPPILSGQREMFADTLLSAAVSRNMAVLKTRPGHATGVAVEIDSIGSPYILGTIAGGDTVMMVIDDSLDKGQIMELLATFIPPTIINTTGITPQVRKND